jgi:hypothetical protein
LLVPALAAVAAAACADFPDVTTVVDLRVLAVRTEPSEIILDDTDPATNLPILVTPLIADPPVDIGQVTWTLVACPNNPYGAAPPATGQNMLAGGGARSTVGSNLCPEGGATTWPLITDPVRADMPQTIMFTADQLKAAAMVDFYVDQFGNFHGGLDLGLPMNLQLTVTDGTQTAVAIKRILYWYTGPDLYWKAPLAPDQKVNVTPEIDFVRAYRERDPDTAAPVEPVMMFDAAPANLTLVAGEHLWIEPHVPDGTAEPYWTTVIAPPTDPTLASLAVPLHVDKERLRFAFYATAGKFEQARTASELPPGFVGTPHLESKYQAPAKLDGLPTDAAGNALVTIWITVRDERGGESWVIRQIALAP